MKWLGPAGVLVVFLAPLGATARTTPAAKPDTVALSFAWKPGMQASVSASIKRTRNAGERTERAATWRYKIRVDPDTAGLRIHFDDPAFEVAGDKAAASSPVATRISEQAAGLMPDFVVAKDGAFKRVQDLAAYQARFRALMKSMMPSTADSTTLQGTQAALTSEPFLSSKVAEHWNQAAAFKELAVENVILLVTEPRGLIPHRMTSTKTVKGTMSVEGKDVPIEQVDVMQTEYAYP